MPYNSKLNADDQIDTEERIAAILFDHEDVEIDEETAAALGRELLHVVLERFRPDLIKKKK